jgi:glycine reductase complex component B subunit alpha and beta
MDLELFDYSIGELAWGEQSALAGKKLTIARQEIESLVSEPSRAIAIDFELVRPGEPKRIIHVLDTVLPIAKIGSGVTTFPGFAGPAQLVGSGQTVRIKNLLVTVVGRFPDIASLTPIEKPREGIIDMAGIGAPYCYGSDYFHLVLTLRPSPTVSNSAFDHGLRMISLRCAKFLAEVGKVDCEPQKQCISTQHADRELPKIVLIYQVQSQLCCARTFYYGEEISRTLPTFVHPAEFFDGALVSGNFKSERKIPTSVHCDHPFIRELLARHGRSLNFLGVILSRGYNDSFEQKKKMGLWVARLARNLGADGAVAMMEGTGNGTVDFMQTVKACEDEGVKTAAVLHESNGPKGYERPLVDHPSEADAMISRGNVSEKIYISPLETVIGGSELDLHLKAKHNPHLPFLFDPTIFFGSYGKMGSSGFRAVYEN